MPAGSGTTLAGDALHVVAGAVVGPDDRILIAQRPAGKHLAGGWEFPGGKLDPGEHRETGLCRELREELGIEVLQCRPLIRLRHAYPERTVLLDVWVVDRYRGEPQSLDGQRLRWCSRDELPDADLLPADRPVVTALRLPPVIWRGGGEHYELRALPSCGDAAASATSRLRGALCDSAGAALAAAAAGADFIAFTQPLPAPELSASCERVGRPVYARGLPLAEAWNLGATGVVVDGGAQSGRTSP